MFPVVQKYPIVSRVILFEIVSHTMKCPKTAALNRNFLVSSQTQVLASLTLSYKPRRLAFIVINLA